MKIELKRIQHSPHLSEETEAFTANLYIQDVHAGYAKNNGHGGSTFYQAKDENGKILIRQAEEYCKKLPPVSYKGDNPTNSFSWEMSLESYIDDLLNKYLEKKEIAKFNAKLNNTMLKGLVYGIPDQSYAGIIYKIPLVRVLATPLGPQIVLKDLKEKILPSLRNENKLLNTNIPESIIKAAGLQADQYVKPIIRDIRYGTIPHQDEDKIDSGRSR